MSQAEEPLYLEELDSLEADDVMRLYHGVSEDPSMMAQYLKPVIESWYNNDRANFDTSLQNLRTYESVTALGQGDADVASMTSLVAHYVTTGSGNSRKSTGSSSKSSKSKNHKTSRKASSGGKSGSSLKSTVAAAALGAVVLGEHSRGARR